jgi:hypothetical protein
MIKKILTSLMLLSLICVVLVGAETRGQSQTISTSVLGQLCSEDGDYIYNDETKGPTSCCAGFVSELVTGAPQAVVGRCTANCVGERESLGAVVPGNDIQCCSGLSQYIPEGIVGTKGTCVLGGESTPDQRGSTSTCPESCVCDEDSISCPTEQQTTITTEIQRNSVRSTSTQDTSGTSTQEEAITTSTVSISKTGTSSTSIQSGNVEVVTSEKVSVTNSKLEMQTSSGSTKEIKVMPEEISEILGTTSIETTELKEESENVVYSITGSKKGKFLFMFPVKMKVQARINAETGEVISSKKPWWAFLAKE